MTEDGQLLYDRMSDPLVIRTEDGQLLYDRMSDPLVVMELIVCKCNRMCKGTECQWFSSALM